jgi:integrase
MNGHVLKRSTRWRVVVECGEQAAQRCPTCRRRYWTDDDEARTCPVDHGELEEIVARRQDVLPGKFATKKDAQKALRNELTEREHGDHVRASDLTVAQYLEDRWLPALGAEDLSPGTLLAYRLHVKRVNAYIGRIPLQALTRSDVGVLAAKLANEPGARGSVLSPASRRVVLVVLHHALGAAVHDGLLHSNPAQGVRRPKVRQPELKTWSKAELAKFLQATRGDRLSPLWRLLAMTGLRRGEALGLKWSDVDLDAGRLSIQRQRVATGYDVAERQTKTGKGRAVPIDVATVEVLRQAAQRQLDDATEWQAAWIGDGHVFCRENGEPWHPDAITKAFRLAVATVDVPSIRLHDLRHGWATMALRAGVHPKIVQERLGHANISMTMDRYSHALPDLQKSAAELVASLIDLAIDDEGQS